MKRIAVVMLCVVALLFSAGTAIAGGELFLYNWSDYTAPDLIKKFEKETGIKVTLDIYDSNETLLAKMKSGGGAYDIIVPTHNFVTILIEEGLIQKVNAAEFKGYENIVEAMKGPPWDPKNEYTIPWNYGSTSFCLNTGAYNPAEESMDTLFNPPAELQGKIGMFDSSEENTNLALVYKGYPQCNEDPAQMQEILDLLLAQKPHVKVYSSEGIHERLVSEDVMMSGCWNGSAMRAYVQVLNLDDAPEDKALGIAQRCFDLSLAYAKERLQSRLEMGEGIRRSEGPFRLLSGMEEILGGFLQAVRLPEMVGQLQRDLLRLIPVELLQGLQGKPV